MVKTFVCWTSTLFSGKGKKDKNDEKSESQSDGEDDDIDEKDWESVSSEEAKVVHIHEGGNKSKKGNKGKEKKRKLDPEEAKRIREENGKLMKTVKKVVKELESSMKDANKANKSSNADEQFKKEVWAAKSILTAAKKLEKKYKERTQETLSFEHTEETAKALKAVLDKKAKAILQIDSMLAGGFDEDQLEQFASAAKKRKEDKEKAEDVQ